jgi:hypothetical protein
MQELGHPLRKEQAGHEAAALVALEPRQLLVQQRCCAMAEERQGEMEKRGRECRDGFRKLGQ